MKSKNIKMMKENKSPGVVSYRGNRSIRMERCKYYTIIQKGINK